MSAITFTRELVREPEYWSLFRAHPELSAGLPRVRLATLPTPVVKQQLAARDGGESCKPAGLRAGSAQQLAARDGGESCKPAGLRAGSAQQLAARDGVDATILVKRDDLAGALYGGNKVRKLEFIFGELLSKGRDSVWTVGAMGSHHCLATALYAQALGMRCHVLHFPQPVTEHVRRNILALQATGAEMVLASKFAMPVEVARRHLKDWLGRGGEGSYTIPAGGSSVWGVIGYLNAAFELAEQVRSGELEEPRRLYVAVGTGGTFVGLWLGCQLAGLQTEVIGVRVVDRVLCNKAVLMSLTQRTSAHLEALGFDTGKCWLRRPMHLVHDQFGAEYGRPTEAAREAVRVASEGGSTLEFTYTGKAFAALLADAKSASEAGKTLFWNTFNSRELTPVSQSAVSKLPAAYQEFFVGEPEVSES
ncbi:MAG: hypothetical protein AUK47_03150 [Deltaproteobacteria bacterium CG2_30_63_29]|nr:MAG: hypothetical protein AUK47_03150 [Deltaproteobacteria bacterium CG2_30_63_29]